MVDQSSLPGSRFYARIGDSGGNTTRRFGALGSSDGASPKKEICKADTVSSLTLLLSTDSDYGRGNFP